MSSQGRPGTRYITPIDSNGAPVTEEGKGRFTLASGQTYHFVGGADEAPFASLHFVGYTAGAVVTSATVRSCNLRIEEVSNQDLTAGQWIKENPGRVTCNADDNGGGTWTQTNGIGAASGGNVGGLFFHICEGGQARVKLTVVVGATGGVFSCAGHGKR